MNNNMNINMNNNMNINMNNNMNNNNINLFMWNNFLNNNFFNPQFNNQIMQMNQMMNQMNANNLNMKINSNLCVEKLNQIVGLETVTSINPCKHKYNDKIYQKITDICIKAIKDNNIDRKNIAIYCVEKLKKDLKGQWFVLIQNINDQNFDFGFSMIKFDEMIIFKFREYYIYVSQIIKNKY